MHRRTGDHWHVLKQLLRYLCGTSTDGLLLSRQSPLSLHAFSDSDWVGHKDDYTFSSGVHLSVKLYSYLFFLMKK